MQTIAVLSNGPRTGRAASIRRVPQCQMRKEGMRNEYSVDYTNAYTMRETGEGGPGPPALPAPAAAGAPATSRCAPAACLAVAD